MDWLNFLKVMIIDEQSAEKKYQLALDLAKDPKVRAVFEKLRAQGTNPREGKVLNRAFDQ